MSNEFKLEMADVVKAHLDVPGFPVLTSNQCHAIAMKLNAMLSAATQPPALGGEPEVAGYGFRNTMVGRSPVMMELRPDIPANDQYGGQLLCPLILLEDFHAHLAPLQAEIERLKEESFEGLYNSGISERDQLQARCDELEAILKDTSEWFDDGVGRSDEEWSLLVRIKAALSKPAGGDKV
ncbi:hypothetical protein CFBP3846_03689 [Pseudomonas syringae pv. avii]|uniref:Uncharacterized protein n=1 Tax=Pseudomonas syringae pv. avii TaxID=663959 RepID=A0ABY1U9Z8_PSESX|nr:hypothetical protein [Pseudomonas syringae]KWT10590.1 hypothetical protein AL046_00825 [Pseudomonas syringae pv. avii]SOS28096.1 hypothetical protein CFBP3846_03689 [Pseudomonas syringae pv. avii]